MQECPVDPVPQEDAIKELLAFLRCPLYGTGEVFSRFRALPNAQYCEGEEPMQRYVYVPGTRKDRVVLIAHADTQWDENYAHARLETTPKIDEEMNAIRGTNPEVGLGADDRAGCALLWLLKDSGHSLLIFDGEEHGHRGAKFLSKNRALLKTINRHRYLLALDYPKKDLCHYHQIPNSPRFRKYIEADLAKKEITTIQGTDLPHVSRRACGANLSVGYYYQHQPEEMLHIPTWYETYVRLTAFLSKEQPRFRTQTYKRFARAAYQTGYKAGSSVYQVIKKVLHIRQG